MAEVTALQFTLREMEMNADVVQQRLEQSQCFGGVWYLWVLGGGGVEAFFVVVGGCEGLGFGGCWMIFCWVVGDSKRCECEVIVRTYGSCFSFMFVSSKGPVPTSKLTNELRHVKQTAATEALCYCLFHDFTMFYPMSLMIHRHPI